MDKIEAFVLSVPSGDRFEKRDIIGKWLQAFVDTDPDCDGAIVERIRFPGQEAYFQYSIIQAYSKTYFWIDLVREEKLDTSRLECMDSEANETILFADDFGVNPMCSKILFLRERVGYERIFPK